MLSQGAQKITSGKGELVDVRAFSHGTGFAPWQAAQEMTPIHWTWPPRLLKEVSAHLKGGRTGNTAAANDERRDRNVRRRGRLRVNMLRRPENPRDTEGSPCALVAIMACEKGAVSLGALAASARSSEGQGCWWGLMSQIGLAESTREHRVLK